ncbi:integrin-alpha FG-GAP repeat-containing protein 2 [Elysia marginata]|uniref:Integrin-alpha FG-GAP repeat-containing protein 2 n=1 Tax=Elysia marginata TaxID=1093978 RepID=A0AAV4GY57_9GAST|nr:integrin-alpha FG-GAP repeat-containing protein 2 [Elysia marginata]
MANDISNTVMRTVSFVERIEVEFHGNVLSQAMVLEDVDNDLGNELIVGNIDGEISIFKGDSQHAWRKATICGMLTCLGVGKIHLPKKNSLVCMTAEGWCHLFDVPSLQSTVSISGTEDETEGKMLKPVFSQELPANAKVMCLADIDSDDHIEMVIGYSDRVVRAFRWHETPNSDTGQFLLLQKWQLAGQIGSITVNYDSDHQPELMVSQPGATFVTLQVKPVFRHIKSDSYLDRLCGTSANIKSSLERSESFAAVTNTSKGFNSPRSNFQHSARIISPPGHQLGSPRRREPAASKSDILAGSSASRQTEDSIPTSSFSIGLPAAQVEQDLRTCKETLKMVDLNAVGKDRPADFKAGSSKLGSSSFTRLCKSESFCDQVEDSVPPCFTNEPGETDLALTETGSPGGDRNDPVAGNSSGAEMALPRLPLSLKTSLEGLDGDLGQGSPLRSYTSNSSPRGSHESGLERSLGRISHILDASFEDDVFKPSIIYHPLAQVQTRNKDTSTVIVGGINRGRPSQSGSGEDEIKPRSTYYALATLDGSLILAENDSILWSLQVDHYLFALSKLDVTGNGKEEVVCCSWNGQTYIVNHSKEIVRYQFPDSVAAFCAGYFSLQDGCNAPCFVYTTFNNRIYIYPNITLPRVESTNLLRVMGRIKEGREILQKLNIAEDDYESIRCLYRYCLYGQPGKR